MQGRGSPTKEKNEENKAAGDKFLRAVSAAADKDTRDGTKLTNESLKKAILEGLFTQRRITIEDESRELFDAIGRLAVFIAGRPSYSNGYIEELQKQQCGEILQKFTPPFNELIFVGYIETLIEFWGTLYDTQHVALRHHTRPASAPVGRRADEPVALPPRPDTATPVRPSPVPAANNRVSPRVPTGQRSRTAGATTPRITSAIDELERLLEAYAEASRALIQAQPNQAQPNATKRLSQAKDKALEDVRAYIESNLTTSRRTIEELGRKLREAETASQQATEEGGRALRECEGLKLRIETLISENQRLGDNLGKAMQESGQMRQHIDSQDVVIARLKELLRGLAELRHKAAELERQLAVAREENRPLQQKDIDQQHEIERLNGEIKRLSQFVQEERSKAGGIDLEKRKAERQRDEAAQARQAAEERLEKEKAALERQLGTATQELERLRAGNTELKGVKDGLQGQLNAQAAEIERLQGVAGGLATEKAELERQLRELQTGSAKEVVTVRSRLEVLTLELQTVSAREQAATRDLQATRAREQKLTAQLQATNDREQKQGERIAALTGQLNARLEELDQIKGLFRQDGDAPGQDTDLYTLVQRLQAERVSLEVQRQTMRRSQEEYGLAQRQLSKERQERVVEKQQLETAVREKDGRLAAQGHEIAKRQDEINRLTGEVARLQQQDSARQRQIAELQVRLQQVASERDDGLRQLQQNAEQLEKLRAELQARDAQILALEVRVHHQEAELVGLRAAGHDNAALQTQLRQSQEGLGVLRVERSSVGEEIGRLRRENGELRRRVSELERQNRDLEDRLRRAELENAVLQAQLAASREQLQVVTGEKGDLEKKLLQKEIELVNLAKTQHEMQGQFEKERGAFNAEKHQLQMAIDRKEGDLRLSEQHLQGRKLAEKVHSDFLSKEANRLKENLDGAERGRFDLQQRLDGAERGRFDLQQRLAEAERGRVDLHRRLHEAMRNEGLVRERAVGLEAELRASRLILQERDRNGRFEVERLAAQIREESNRSDHERRKGEGLEIRLEGLRRQKDQELQGLHKERDELHKRLEEALKRSGPGFPGRGDPDGDPDRRGGYDGGDRFPQGRGRDSYDYREYHELKELLVHNGICPADANNAQVAHCLATYVHSIDPQKSYEFFNYILDPIAEQLHFHQTHRVKDGIERALHNIKVITNGRHKGQKTAKSLIRNINVLRRLVGFGSVGCVMYNPGSVIEAADTASRYLQRVGYKKAATGVEIFRKRVKRKLADNLKVTIGNLSHVLIIGASSKNINAEIKSKILTIVEDYKNNLLSMKREIEHYGLSFLKLDIQQSLRTCLFTSLNEMKQIVGMPNVDAAIQAKTREVLSITNELANIRGVVGETNIVHSPSSNLLKTVSLVKKSKPKRKIKKPSSRSVSPRIKIASLMRV